MAHPTAPFGMTDSGPSHSTDSAPSAPDLGAPDGRTPATPDHRQPPHSIETEQALLGAILVNNEAYFEASTRIDAIHFYEPLHAQIFETIGRLIDKGRVAAPLSVAHYLEGDPVLQEVGGASYLANLAAAATAIIHAGDYAQSIFDLAVRRGLIQIGEEMVNRAYEANIEDEPGTQITEAEQRLYEIAEKGKYGSGVTPFHKALEAAIETADAAYKRDGGMSGIATGFADMDRKLGGLQKSDLIILAGRPAMGKTSLATNMAFNIAKSFSARKDPTGKETLESGGRILFFSLEMSADQLATRVLAEQAMVPSHKIRDGTITREDFSRLTEAVAEIQHIPLHIDDTGGVSISAIMSRARRLARKPGVDVIIIDYVQLITGSAGKKDVNRVQELTQITTGLKALAKELSVPIIGLSQLSRAVESRDDKRPQLSDLRESGSIEQDADIVLFIFREEYYHDQKRPADFDFEGGMSTDQQAILSGKQEELAQWQEKKDLIKNLAEVIIAKHRHGPTGVIKLHFDPEITRFHNYAGPDRDPGM